MRRLLLLTTLLVIGCGPNQGGSTQPTGDAPASVPPAPALPPDEPPPLHTEKGLKSQLTIEAASTPMYIIDRANNKLLGIAGSYHYHRFLIGDVLHGSQARKLDNHILDDFQLLTVANPWDNIAVLGALQSFDIRQEPLTYHHRTGPMGAVYRELRTRTGGKDAKAPVAVLGMNAGEQACYALLGQTMTFYEADPVVKKLVADTDKYFSYIADVRKRGATIDIQVGNRRAKLKEEKGKKYALIVVDVAESFPHPTDIFTKEAVQEYFDRLTDDGFVMLHISNKELRFEPMVAKIAEELMLTARLWADESDRRHGKTASCWVVLTRREKFLGTLGLPVDRQASEYDSQFRLLETHPDIPAWTDKNTSIPEAMKFKR